jgi:hypothetical protein
VISDSGNDDETRDEKGKAKAQPAAAGRAKATVAKVAPGKSVKRKAGSRSTVSRSYPAIIQVQQQPRPNSSCRVLKEGGLPSRSHNISIALGVPRCIPYALSNEWVCHNLVSGT